MNLSKEERSTRQISPKLSEEISDKLHNLKNGKVEIFVKTGYVIAIETSEREHLVSRT